MATFVEGFGFFTRWLNILMIGALLGALISCLLGYRFARRQAATFEFADALLFSAVGGTIAPTLATAVALALGSLGSDGEILTRALQLLLNTALLGLIGGLAVGVPLGFVAAWGTVRRGGTSAHQRDRRQN